VRVLSGEPAVVVTLPTAGNAVTASVHVETRGGRIVALAGPARSERVRYLDGGAR